LTLFIGTSKAIERTVNIIDELRSITFIEAVLLLYHSRMPDMSGQPEESVKCKRDYLEPRWPAAIAIVAIAGLYYVLPETLLPGPNWLPLLVVIPLMITTTIAHRTGRAQLNLLLGHIALGLVTVSMIWSLGMLIMRLPKHLDPPQVLLRAAAALWVANILVFASWYWRLDAGGPNQRDLREAHTEGAFLFPQMVIPGKHHKNWTPGFVDYLFLAFNSSTAFSPTDVPVISRWAKLMMMVQASISLATVALIAARAVNIL